MLTTLELIGRVVACLYALGCTDADVNRDGRMSAADLVAAHFAVTADPTAYRRVTIADDPSPSGVFDPSLLFPEAGATGWMAYSAVDYHEDGGFLVRDVYTRIAASSDGGATWRSVATVNQPATAAITTGSNALCGQPTCSGRMISEVSFWLDDRDDPQPQQRYKLFSHRYFLYPPAGEGVDTQLSLGSINVRAAATPDGPWTDDQPLFGWNLTPPEIAINVNVNALGSVMARCLLVTEGSALAFDDAVDFVFACPYFTRPLDPNSLRQRIVLLRSDDRLASFRFVATLLEPEDAAGLGGTHVSAPTLFVMGEDVYLLVTPVSPQGRYAGCGLIRFADRINGRLERDVASKPIFRRFLPTQAGRYGGACAWDAAAGSTGILISQLDQDGINFDPFRIYATGALP